MIVHIDCLGLIEPSEVKVALEKLGVCISLDEAKELTYR